MAPRDERGAAGEAAAPYGRGGTVLLSDFVYVDCPYRQLGPVLLEPGAPWLSRLPSLAGKRPVWRTAKAGAWGEAAALVRLGRGPKGLRPLAVLTLGTARQVSGSVIVPLRWDPVSFEFMLPKLEGDMQATQLEAAVSRLELRATYRAPFHRIGEGLDRLAMHRAAEAGARGFLQELAGVLARPFEQASA